MGVLSFLRHAGAAEDLAGALRESGARFAALGRHDEATWSFRWATYYAWRAERWRELHGGAQLPVPTVAEWEAVGHPGPTVRQLTMF